MIVMNLWLESFGAPFLVRIDFIKSDGLYCSRWRDGEKLGIFFIEHKYAQKSFLERLTRFVKPPSWAKEWKPCQ